MTGTASEVVQYLMEQSRAKPDAKWDVTEHKQQRSLDSNNYFYLLVNKIAKKQRISDVEVHDKFLSENIEYFTNDDGAIDWKVSPVEPNQFGLIKEQVNGNFEYYKDSGMSVKLQKGTGDNVKYKDGTDVEGRVYWHIRGSRQMDSKAMSRLISSVVFEAEQLGIPTMTPDEIERMNALWGKKHNHE